ncbi:MAG: site-specific integrase [Rhodospirillales bacterium]|nr:site-specific integrase [Rhodospirillales bacterium]
MTLNQAAGRYFEEKSKNTRSRQNDDYQLANLIKGLCASTFLSDITENQISAYAARRRNQVGPASVNREIELLRRVFRRAQTVWRVDIGEMPAWKELLFVEPEGRKRELSRNEEVRLMAREELPEDLGYLAQFCILTGMRKMNAIQLTWSQVHWDEGEIKIRVKSRKPGGEEHTIPISSAVRGLLAAQYGKHPIFVFSYICRRSRGGRRKGERYPFSASGWRGDWKRSLEAAQVEDFKFHDTRHTAGTRTARVGGLHAAKELLGHKDIASTMRYTHVTRDDVREAMERAESRNNPEPAPIENANPLKGRK